MIITTGHCGTCQDLADLFLRSIRRLSPEERAVLIERRSIEESTAQWEREKFLRMKPLTDLIQ